MTKTANSTQKKPAEAQGKQGASAQPKLIKKKIIKVKKLVPKNGTNANKAQKSGDSQSAKPKAAQNADNNNSEAQNATSVVPLTGQTTAATEQKPLAKTSKTANSSSLIKTVSQDSGANGQAASTTKKEDNQKKDSDCKSTNKVDRKLPNETKTSPKPACKSSTLYTNNGNLNNSGQKRNSHQTVSGMKRTTKQVSKQMANQGSSAREQ